MKQNILKNLKKKTDLKQFNDYKVFIEYPNDIEEYNPNKKSKMLIVSDDIIPDMLSNENSIQ